MGVTRKRWCDFFVCTTQDSFCEIINFDDEQFWNLSVTKACTFYHIILEKLFMRHIRKESESALFSVLDMLQ